MFEGMQDFEDRVGLAPGRIEQLREITREHGMLCEIVAWMARHQPTPELVRIVDQDEYCNDVVIAFEELWLVYDCS